jgi:hypothetical protein
MAGKAGSQIEDEKQEYQFSVPWITPSGHELSFYDTPGNQRLVLKHTSGSHIEFKTDGSVFLKAVKDLHVNASVASSQQPGAGGAQGASGSDASTMRFEADLELEVQGTLKITANKLEIDVNETSKIISGTDMVMTANNIIEKANENISMEATKSMYVDTKEYRERSVSHRTEEGTMENGGEGGINYMNVKGNYIINNTDENGGITLMSKGYLNLVCGKERVDLVGKYTDKPSAEGKGTFTQKVSASTGTLDKSTVPGDYYFESDAGAFYNYAKTTGSSSGSGADGLKQEVTVGNMTQAVTAGQRTRTVSAAETITIGGIQTVKAAQIYLN